MSRFVAVFLGLWGSCTLGICLAAEPVPDVIRAAACSKPPQIDGVIEAKEWQAATPLSMSLSFASVDPALAEDRPCKLWVMNSANALYVALQVPDATLDESVAPLLLDGALLAFNDGPDLASLSDRKVIAPGLYRDKHFAGPGKGDADDAKQDGLGVMKRKAGMVTLEWAVPLQSADKHDVQLKPGQEIRFNIVYFDALQLPLTKTAMGGVYGAALDQANGWGTLQLASDVADDGGAAFNGPAWSGQVQTVLNELAPSRLRVTSETSKVTGMPGAGQFAVTFSYVDPQGEPAEAQATVYLPPRFSPTSKTRFPLLLAAGYELPAAVILPFLHRDWIVVSPSKLPTNPLIRLMNPDVALLHLARQLPWVDDARVMIAGSSAGGWMTLMLTAETFPLAGSMPDVPPVNWGYNAAYFYNQLKLAGPKKGTFKARVPALFSVGTALVPTVKVHGGDFNDETWFASSPVAHTSTITCPVSIYWSTADVLVPVDQVGKDWVQPAAEGVFPETFTMQPDKLLTSREGRLTLIEALDPADYEVFTITVPAGTRLQHGAEGTGKLELRELPISADKHWSITIIDEGAPAPTVDHRKYALLLTRNQFLNQISTQPIAVSQLTLPKLKRLMARYAGQEWLPSRLKHLDLPAAEQADVLRGLRTYVAVSPAHRTRFEELYSQLPTAEQHLSAEQRQKILSTAP